MVVAKALPAIAYIGRPADATDHSPAPPSLVSSRYLIWVFQVVSIAQGVFLRPRTVVEVKKYKKESRLRLGGTTANRFCDIIAMQ